MLFQIYSHLATHRKCIEYYILSIRCSACYSFSGLGSQKQHRQQIRNLRNNVLIIKTKPSLLIRCLLSGLVFPSGLARSRCTYTNLQCNLWSSRCLLSWSEIPVYVRIDRFGSRERGAQGYWLFSTGDLWAAVIWHRFGSQIWSIIHPLGINNNRYNVSEIETNRWINVFDLIRLYDSDVTL